MVSARTALVSAAVLALALGCTKSRTEVVVITTTDLTIPSEVDEIRIDVEGPRGNLMSANADLRDRPPPRSLGLQPPEGGALGPYRVTARALSGGAVVVERVAVFDFLEGQTRVLRMELLRSCRTTMCGADETCAAAGCRSERVTADELEAFEGLPDAGVPPEEDAGRMDGGGVDAGPPDAGPLDAGPCTPTAEICNGMDDDCDGVPDNGFDLMTDPANCGMCGSPCAGTCSGGSCDTGCPAGFDDCDGNPSNGCEANLMTSRDDCGMCGTRCRGTTGTCCSGTCC